MSPPRNYVPVDHALTTLMPTSDELPPLEPHPVVIIGGGVAGLSAALHLAERGLRPLVLEADPHYFGGRLAGGDEIVVDGWRFRAEHGVHGIWAPYRNLQAMLARHNLRPVLVPAEEESWYYQRELAIRSAPVGSAIRHSLFPPPFHYLQLFLRADFLRILTITDWMFLIQVWVGLLMAVGIDPLVEGQPMKNIRLSDMINYWPPALRSFFVGLARNGLAARPDEIPFAGFVAFLRFYTLMRRDTWEFGYLPTDGGSSVIEPLVRRIEQLGGRLELGRRVARLDANPAGWQISLQEPASPATLLARQVILATDAKSAAAILAANPSLETDHLFWPYSAETAIARFWFDRPPRPSPEAGIFSGEFMTDNFFWLHRIYDPYRLWHRATGGSALEVHFYGPPELLANSDPILLGFARREVLGAFPELSGHQRHQALQRNPASHTLLSPGPVEDHLGIRTPWEGLFCCGDWVYHPTPAFFLERACVTGIEAANAVLSSHNLPTWPLMEYLPPEPLAGWIERLMRAGRRTLRRKSQRKNHKDTKDTKLF